MTIAVGTVTRRTMLGLASGLAAMAMLAAPTLAEDPTLKVELWDKSDGTQGVTLSSDTVKAGPTKLEITNTTTTKQDHEFLFVKTDLTPDQLAFKSDGAKVDEDALPGIDEVGDIEPGETKSAVVTLEPGRYMFFCNEEGHFKAGMVAFVTVTE